MKATLHVLTLIAALAFGATTALAGPKLFTPPVAVGGQDYCLECLVANVSDEIVKVKIRGFADDGTVLSSRLVRLEPRSTTSTLPVCDEVGNYSCDFEVTLGDRDQIRAGACEFVLSFGCAAAVTAR